MPAALTFQRHERPARKLLNEHNLSEIVDDLMDTVNRHSAALEGNPIVDAPSPNPWGGGEQGTDPNLGNAVGDGEGAYGDPMPNGVDDILIPNFLYRFDSENKFVKARGDLTTQKGPLWAVKDSVENNKLFVPAAHGPHLLKFAAGSAPSRNSLVYLAAADGDAGKVTTTAPAIAYRVYVGRYIGSAALDDKNRGMVMLEPSGDDGSGWIVNGSTTLTPGFWYGADLATAGNWALAYSALNYTFLRPEFMVGVTVPASTPFKPLRPGDVTEGDVKTGATWSWPAANDQGLSIMLTDQSAAADRGRVMAATPAATIKRFEVGRQCGAQNSTTNRIPFIIYSPRVV